MKIINSLSLFALLLTLAITAEAQKENQPQSYPQAVKNAPYSAEAVNETVKSLPDGNKITTVWKESKFRDSEGRTRMETESVFANKTRKKIQITDPATGYEYFLNPVTKTAFRQQIKPLPVFTGTKPSPTGYSSKFEKLENKTILGIEATGNRSVITVAPGTIGNEKPIETVYESWYSPKLKITLMSSRKDPNMGDGNYKVTKITRDEPERNLFKIPADYKIVDQSGITDQYFSPSDR